VLVAWPHRAPSLPALPGRLGIVHCLNRACSLLVAHLPRTSSPDQARRLRCSILLACSCIVAVAGTLFGGFQLCHAGRCRSASP
jgi:hypothetical protein